MAVISVHGLHQMANEAPQLRWLVRPVHKDQGEGEARLSAAHSPQPSRYATALSTTASTATAANSRVRYEIEYL